MVDVIDISEIETITPLDITRKIKSVEADLDYYLRKKENEFEKTQPKATLFDRLIVSGGAKREDLFDKYVISSEELDPIIDFLQNEIKSLNILLEDKLKSSGEYSIILLTIIGLKERGYSWSDIEKEYIATGKICVSLGTCRNIWKKHIGKRDV